MDNLPRKVYVVACLLMMIGSSFAHRLKTDQRSASDLKQNENHEPHDHRFFLKQIFDKYGHQGIISFEGFEHLMENLGLGRLVFEKSHNLSLHKVNGSFQEVHDSLHLHEHTHGQEEESVSRTRRQVKEADEEETLTSYSEPLTQSGKWSNQCLTPQDILETFGLEPHHNVVISHHVFLNLCPAIIYELDQRSCYSEKQNQIITSQNEEFQASAWMHATISVLFISLTGLFGVVMVPLVQRTFFQQVLHFLVALAVGTMCGDALIHLLPHALIISHVHTDEQDHVTPVFRATVTFLTIIFFFIVEKILHHIKYKHQKASNGTGGIQTVPIENNPLNSTEDFEIVVEQKNELKNALESHGHQHCSEGQESVASVAWMVIMGDGLHNLTDGLAIGAAFSGDIVAGFATTLAVLCHELPHELGDFAVLLQAGMNLHKAIVYNIVSSILSFIGMAIGVWVGEYDAASQWIYAFTAGTFLYISLVDLIPELNNYSSSSKGFTDIIFQLAGIISGAGIMFIIAIYEDDLSTIFD